MSNLEADDAPVKVVDVNNTAAFYRDVYEVSKTGKYKTFTANLSEATFTISHKNTLSFNGNGGEAGRIGTLIFKGQGKNTIINATSHGIKIDDGANTVVFDNLSLVGDIIMDSTSAKEVKIKNCWVNAVYIQDASFNYNKLPAFLSSLKGESAQTQPPVPTPVKQSVQPVPVQQQASVTINNNYNALRGGISYTPAQIEALKAQPSFVESTKKAADALHSSNLTSIVLEAGSAATNTLKQGDNFRTLALAYAITGEQKYKDKAEQYLDNLLGASMNKDDQSRDPVRKTYLEPYFVGLDLLLPHLSEDKRAKTISFLKDEVVGKMEGTYSGSNTKNNNYTSHALKIKAMVAVVTGDVNARKNVQSDFSKFLETHVDENGATYDFREDGIQNGTPALYHYFSLQSLFKTFQVLDKTNKVYDIGGNYSLQKGDGEKLVKAAAYLLPEATGGKVIPNTYVEDTKKTELYNGDTKKGDIPSYLGTIAEVMDHFNYKFITKDNKPVSLLSVISEEKGVGKYTNELFGYFPQNASAAPQPQQQKLPTPESPKPPSPESPKPPSPESPKPQPSVTIPDYVDAIVRNLLNKVGISGATKVNGDVSPNTGVGATKNTGNLQIN